MVFVGVFFFSILSVVFLGLSIAFKSISVAIDGAREAIEDVAPIVGFGAVVTGAIAFLYFSIQLVLCFSGQEAGTQLVEIGIGNIMEYIVIIVLNIVFFGFCIKFVFYWLAIFGCWLLDIIFSIVGVFVSLLERIASMFDNQYTKCFGRLVEFVNKS